MKPHNCKKIKWSYLYWIRLIQSRKANNFLDKKSIAYSDDNRKDDGIIYSKIRTEFELCIIY